MKKNFSIPCLIAMLLVAVGTTGCRSMQPNTAWDQEFLMASKSSDQGDVDHAQRHFIELRKSAPTKTRMREVDFELAMSAVDKGDADTAMQQLRSIWQADRVDAVGARAMYEYARLVARDDADSAEELYKQLILKFPDHAPAEFALWELVKTYRHPDKTKRGMQTLMMLAEDVEKSSIVSKIYFEAAGLEQDYLGNEREAIRLYYQAYNRCSLCPVGEHSLWNIAQIFARHQIWAPAIEIWEILATGVESSWFIGTYNSPWAGQARIELASTHLLFRGDFERARHHFEQFIRDFPDHLLTDDAAFYSADTYRLEGKSKRYKRALQNFIKNYPQSRFVDLANKRLGTDQ